MSRVALCLALTLAVAPAWADLARQTSQLFETMVNVNAPISHMGQRRGVLSGGGVSARNRIINENLISFVPPSFQAGCGGIDLFAGSFSFINAEQFQQLMRTVAANATGYAFQIALQSMCPTCMDTIQDLQRKIQSLNELFSNSCQLAQGLVNDMGSAFNEKLRQDTSKVSLVKGLGDVFETFTASSGRDPVQQVEENTNRQERSQRGLTGNLVWQALKQNNAAGMFVNGNDELNEAIMSLTGTIIIDDPEAAPDGRGRNFAVRHRPGNLLSVNDLLWASRYQGPLADEGRGQRVFLYACDNRAADECRNPRKQEVTNLQGLVQQVRNLLLGNPRTAGSIGLVQKLRYGTNALSAAEKSFLDNAPGGYGAMIRDLARYDVGGAEAFVNVGAPVIAIEMVSTVLQDLLRGAQVALASTDHAYTQQLTAQIDRVQRELWQQQTAAASRYGNPQTLAAYYAHLMVATKFEPSIVGDNQR